MSLTTFLDLKDVKANFRLEFPKPQISFGTLIAPALTKNYSLVGTAFDYLIRFYLQRHCSFSTSKPWIARSALRFLKKGSRSGQTARNILDYAEYHHHAYLEEGIMTDELITGCLLLAQLDPVFRRKVIVPNLGKLHKQDALDLKNLLSAIPNDIFIPRHTCLLNPTFGLGSHLVGGADADLVIDNTIIDLKTTIKPWLYQDHYNQIVGYYILSRLGAVKNAAPHLQIKTLAIYSSRYAYLYSVAVAEIASEEKWLRFSDWFQERAKQEFGTYIVPE